MMKKVLVIESSLQGKNGNSSRASSLYVEALRKTLGQEKSDITTLDLTQENLPHLNAEEFLAWNTPAEERSERQIQLASLSENYIKSVKQSDIIVLAVPMYNFGMPSVLKAFFDRIARAGLTFQYTENGPVGLLTGKKVVVLAVRGGKYEGTPADSQSSYLKTFLNFIGINDIEFVYVEGLAMGEESAEFAWRKFNEKIIEPKLMLEH